MGHLRLGRLPATKPWLDVIEKLRLGDSINELAAATADAAESELHSARGDPAVGITVWLLTQVPLAARSPHFAARLGELGFHPGAERSPLALVAGFSKAVDQQVAGSPKRTDLGELTRQAASESLSAFLSAGTQSLFDTATEDVRHQLGRLATKDRFAALARDFFARLTQKTLEYYLSRELPNHVGPDKSLPSIDREIDFSVALERHCREAALIVEDFAGGWFSKSTYQGTLTQDSAQRFAAYALKKMRDELRARRTGDG